MFVLNFNLEETNATLTHIRAFISVFDLRVILKITIDRRTAKVYNNNVIRNERVTIVLLLYR